MIPAEIKNAVLKKMKMGYPIGELKVMLEKEGYSEVEINECFEKPRPDMRSWYLFFGLLFFISGLWVIMRYNHFELIILGTTLILLYFKEEDKRKK